LAADRPLNRQFNNEKAPIELVFGLLAVFIGFELAATELVRDAFPSKLLGLIRIAGNSDNRVLHRLRPFAIDHNEDWNAFRFGHDPLMHPGIAM